MSDPVAVYFQTGINYYVPKMQAAPGVGDDGLYTQSLGTPIANSVNNIMTTAVGTITNVAKLFNAVSNPTIYPFTVDAVFGRTFLVQGGTAGDNAVLTIRGVDYLGQPVAENITLSGVSSLQTNKAMKRIDSISVAAGNANASSTIQVGYGTKLGMPYRTQVVLYEFANDVLASTGTVTQPNTVDPQTATTGDPRGTYTPSSTLNGTNVITINARTSAVRNTNDNGGLHGLRHFFA